MKLKSQDRVIKPRGFKRFINSFKYSFEGLVYAYRNEQSLFIHVCMTILVIILGLLLKLERYEWLFLFIIIGLILSTELMNTAIETTIDLMCKEFNIKAKIAKDTASASVFVLAIIAVVGGIYIFLPKILALL